MTDPERISKRSSGLAAQLLQAGVEEQPAEASVQQTLAALGVSAAVVSTSGTASAVAGSAKGVLGAGTGSAAVGGSAATGAVKAVSATLLVKWIGIGVLGGVGLAGAAAVASGPAVQPATSQLVVAAPTHVPQLVSSPAPVTRELPRDLPPESSPVEAPVGAVTPVPSAPAPHVNAGEPVSAPATLEIGAPLAAEVAYVDRARALLASGQVEAGLALLRGYERDFPEARLLPEVLFLQLETCDRLGRTSEARAAAQRLLDGFPKSPHASRARKLLFP